MSSIDKFKTIHEYHFDCLKNMFHLHYKTWRITRKYRNEYWTLHLSDSVIHELRVHLSWVVVKDPTSGGGTFSHAIDFFSHAEK